MPIRLLILGCLFCPALAGQTSAPPSDFPPAVLAAEAKAADSPEGNYKYARHLTAMVMPFDKRDPYIGEFAARLSKADLSARHNERTWIPESAVAQAFNELMHQFDAKHVHAPKTDVSVVHQIRIISSEVLPEVGTVKEHPSDCLPSEAMEIMYQLIGRNGSLAEECPPKPGPDGRPVPRSCVLHDAIQILFEYARSHPASDAKKGFDRVAQIFGL
jgi:hypothetical protein